MVSMKRREELKKKYEIIEVGGGNFGEGFYDCLNAVDRGIIKKREAT